MKHLLAATALGVLMSPAFADIQVRSATLAYDTTLNVTWARDTLLFDTVAARVGGAQALKEEIYRISPTVFELQNLTWPSDGRDRVTGQWYQFLNFNWVGDNKVFTDYSVDVAGNTTMNWYGANAFVNYLNLTAYEGVTNWRLPGMTANGNHCIANLVIGGRCPYSRDNNEVQSLMYSLGMVDQDNWVWTSQPNSPLYFRGLRNTRQYLMRDQTRRYTLTPQDGLVFTNPADWYLAGVTANDALFDSVTGAQNVLVTGLIQPKTDYAYFIMLRDGDVLAAAPPVPEPSTWALMLGGLGLVALRHWRRIEQDQRVL